MHNFKKEFGQNFLKSGRFPQKLVTYLDIQPEDTLIEIGPGEGVLSSLLVKTGNKVIAIEIDYSLLPQLIKRFDGSDNFNLINNDFLQVDLNSILEENHSSGLIKFTGSLPYNISKKIILKILKFNLEQTRFKISKMAFIVQDEVAIDYASKAPKASLLSNLTRLYAELKKEESIPKSQFYPTPKVNGGILLITPKTEMHPNYTEIESLMKIAYSSPRKTLYNNLKSSRKWDANFLELFKAIGINEKARSSELMFEQWGELYISLTNSQST